jgi:hypothetical protein
LPRPLATALSARLATLHELDTVYGVRDLWWLLEVNTVDVHNRMVVNNAQQQGEQ